jgi:hypothetical protein
MAHAQKPDFVFRRKGRVHLNRQGRQFSRWLATEVCASALVMLDITRSEVVWEYWQPTPFTSFLFTSPPVRHRVPSGFKRTLPLGLAFKNTMFFPHTVFVSYVLIADKTPITVWTHNPQLHTIPNLKTKHKIRQAATTCIILSSSWWWA